MARALQAWALIEEEKNSVRNLRYGPRTQLVRGINNNDNNNNNNNNNNDNNNNNNLLIV